VTARDREADLIGHVRTHETCTPECDDFRRLLGEVDGAARVRERVEAALASRVGWPPREKDWLIATMNREAAP
jgi:hypothetical protein